jgi:hypothetical protein
MAQMELDYMQRVAEADTDSIRCILTTDAEAAFQAVKCTNITASIILV